MSPSTARLSSVLPRLVTDVSWRDAKAYVDWLSSKTTKKYRLPSEAEWEYAARGGTKTTFWWGRDVGTKFANCRDCGGGSGQQAITTGSFAANPFGLFDTAGNAAEWVEDCWNDSYRGAPRDGYVWSNGQCAQRVLRVVGIVPLRGLLPAIVGIEERLQRDVAVLVILGVTLDVAGVELARILGVENILARCREARLEYLLGRHPVAVEDIDDVGALASAANLSSPVMNGCGAHSRSTRQGE